MKIYKSIILTVVTALAFTACKNDQNAELATIEPPVDTVAVAEEPEVQEPVATEPTESYFESKASEPTAPAPKPKRTVTKKVDKSPAETIYVETDGAQGRVWGHVTMRGDRGTGTIHDWDENTLTVTVTRNGNELFAVDQNSRQYVFKLKNQKKTQE